MRCWEEKQVLLLDQIRNHLFRNEFIPIKCICSLDFLNDFVIDLHSMADSMSGFTINSVSQTT